MSVREQRAVRRVLTEAAAFPRFFDLSDAQRLNWMIARAYRLGVATGRGVRSKPSGRRAGARAGGRR